jgi:hypothetical protein
MSEVKTGKHFSNEHRNNISKSKMGDKNPMYGKHLTDDHKRKIGESNKKEKQNAPNS